MLARLRRGGRCRNRRDSAAPAIALGVFAGPLPAGGQRSALSHPMRSAAASTMMRGLAPMLPFRKPRASLPGQTFAVSCGAGRARRRNDDLDLIHVTFA